MKIEMEGASSRVRLLCCPAASLGGERRNFLLIQRVSPGPSSPGVRGLGQEVPYRTS